MRCEHCGAQLSTPVRFCTQCGSRLRLVPPRSSQPVPPNSVAPIASARPPPIPPRDAATIANPRKHLRTSSYVFIILLLVVLSFGVWWGLPWWRAHRNPPIQRTDLRSPQGPSVSSATITRSATVIVPASVQTTAPGRAARQSLMRPSLPAAPAPASSSSPTTTVAISSARRTQLLRAPPKEANMTSHAVSPNPYATKAYELRKEKELKKLLKGHGN